MDAQQRTNALLESARLAVGILANPANQDFELVDVDAWPLPDNVTQRFQTRGLEFVGVIGLLHSACAARLVLEVEIPDSLGSAITREFCRVYESALSQTERLLADPLERPGADDEVRWLESLHGLRDTRPHKFEVLFAEKAASHAC